MKYIFNLLLLVAIFPVNAGLVPLDDEDLSKTSGQAIFKIEEYTSTVDGQTSGAGQIDFTRLTLGLRIEVNQNIDRLILGNYHRENGQDCHENGRFCDNNPGSFEEPGFAKWACSNSSCGGITDDDGNDPFQASALVYGDLIGLSGGEKLIAAAASLFGNAYTNSSPFRNNADVFPSNFEYTPHADAQLRDVSLGFIQDHADGTQTLTDALIEKPFVEFAYTGQGNDRQIAGLRVGFGSQTGVMGNAIDVITGFVQPVVTATADAGWPIGSGTFTFAPYLGGTRTAGYIDTEKTLVGDCSGSSLICDQVATATDISHSSPQAQLFPLQNVGLEDSKAFWFSFQSRAITYEPDHIDNDGDGATDVILEYETAQPGFWINMGALGVKYGDGSIVPLTEISNATGFTANTTRPYHPDNYFDAHPLNDVYVQQNNINNGYY